MLTVPVLDTFALVPGRGVAAGQVKALLTRNLTCKGTDKIQSLCNFHRDHHLAQNYGPIQKMHWEKAVEKRHLNLQRKICPKQDPSWSCDPEVLKSLKKSTRNCNGGGWII